MQMFYAMGNALSGLTMCEVLYRSWQSNRLGHSNGRIRVLWGTFRGFLLQARPQGNVGSLNEGRFSTGLVVHIEKLFGIFFYWPDEYGNFCMLLTSIFCKFIEKTQGLDCLHKNLDKRSIETRNYTFICSSISFILLGFFTLICKIKEVANNRNSICLPKSARQFFDLISFVSLIASICNNLIAIQEIASVLENSVFNIGSETTSEADEGI